MRQPKHTISQRAQRDYRKAMRTSFEKRERALYPDDKLRLERCKMTGKYLVDTVQIAYVDWKCAWNEAVRHERKSLKSN